MLCRQLAPDMNFLFEHLSYMYGFIIDNAFKNKF